MPPVPSSLPWQLFWQQPKHHLKTRWQRWFLSRSPLDDTAELTHRNVYILPTATGWLLAATLLVLLIASINYQLSLGYLLTFLLAGSVAASLYACHANLRGLRLSLQPPQAHFLGQPAQLNITLHNPDRSSRFGLRLQLQGQDKPIWLDLAAHSNSSAQLRFEPDQRGKHAIPIIWLETRFPLGAFRAWSPWRPAAQVLTFPAPEDNAPPLPEGFAAEGSAPAVTVDSEPLTLDSVRPYRKGDPLRRVVWKKAAHSDNLVSRDSEPLQQGQLWLDLAQCGNLPLELALSRLCAWVLEAERAQLDYGLRLPNQQIEPSRGTIHQYLCLEALALC